MPDAQQEKHEPGWLTARDAAAYLNVGRRTIVYYIRTGKLKEGQDYKKDIGRTSTFIYRIAQPALDRLVVEKEKQVAEHVVPGPDQPSEFSPQPDRPAAQPAISPAVFENVKREAAEWKIESRTWQTRYQKENEWRTTLQSEQKEMRETMKQALLVAGASKYELLKLLEGKTVIPNQDKDSDQGVPFDKAAGQEEPQAGPDT